LFALTLLYGSANNLSGYAPGSAYIVGLCPQLIVPAWSLELGESFAQLARRIPLEPSNNHSGFV
ncbi:MAG TPA: hypothetical protein VMV40_10115, partial [Acidiferrobacter sp.]|nr:hypothetical protein [Acidiferrobacter sp.]